jgi:hypothetical protein
MAYLEGLRRYATAKITRKIVQPFKNQSSTNQTYRVSPSTHANKSTRRYPIARPPSRTNRGPLPANRHFFKRLSDTDSRDAASGGRTISGANNDSFFGLTRAPIIEGFDFRVDVAFAASARVCTLGSIMAAFGGMPSASSSPNNPSWRASLSTLSRLAMRHLLAKRRAAQELGQLRSMLMRAYFPVQIGKSLARMIHGNCASSRRKSTNTSALIALYQTEKRMSKILQAAHDLSVDLYAISTMDALTMQMMDALCASPPDFVDLT